MDAPDASLTDEPSRGLSSLDLILAGAYGLALTAPLFILLHQAIGPRTLIRLVQRSPFAPENEAFALLTLTGGLGLALMALVAAWRARSAPLRQLSKGQRILASVCSAGASCFWVLFLAGLAA